jgi:hypothetical protein
VIHAPVAQDLAPDDMFLRVVLFRLFSKESTWQAIEESTGGLQRTTLHLERLAQLLDDLRSRQAIYTSAFILPPDRKSPNRPKHRNHLELVARMFGRDGISTSLAQARSLRDVYRALLEWPTIGPFLGYQIAIDLNYTPYMRFSENDFTVPGPGAVRGLRKVFSSFGSYRPEHLIQMMVEHQEDEFARLGIQFDNLFGRRLHAIDCQGLFCEIDKYSRRAFPELKSERVRIKHRFTPSGKPLRLFYPPKWGINDRLPSTAHSTS